ncbi:MAG: c-type cytochrome [Luteitalea sp.]|nr:c-type cytochrome [Luteitalea sp.]
MNRFILYSISLLLLLPGCRVSGGSSAAEEPQLYLPDDLEATVWAESPSFYNPTNMDIDHRGRIWIAEAVNYRDYRNDPQDRLNAPKGDRVVILEDTNGDGKADHSKVFVQDEDLRAPLGIAVLGTKVIVSSSPSAIIYTDEDGDDKPDKKEVFLTGFGGYDHDHGLHAFVAGPDGRWHFNVGNAGPHKVQDAAGWNLRAGSLYAGGSPYNTRNEPALESDDGRIWVGGLALRIDPDGSGLTVLAHNFRNAYELTLDSFGNIWQNDNDDQVVTCRTTWVMENGNAGYASDDGRQSWQASRRPGQDMFTAHWRQEDPGVMPAGDNTGAGAPAGIVLYEDDLFGSEYRGMLLSADAGRNVIFGYKPTVQGAGYDLSSRFDFATSVAGSTEDYKWNVTEQDARKWFRPSDVAIGTDGAVYIADWYDPIVGGHAMHDTAGFGRIYRIAPKDKTLKAPNLDLNSTAGQIQALLSPAINVRNIGFVKLLEQGEEVLREVAAIVQDEPNPYHKARAIWLLAQLGESGKKRVEALLEHPNPLLRITAFRALRVVEPDVLSYVQKLASDASAAVRREAAIALRDVPLEECSEVVLALSAGYDGNDRWYLEALGSAMAGKEAKTYPLLLKKYGDDPMKWDDRMAGLVWRLHPDAAADALAQRAAAESLPASQRHQAMTGLGFIPTKEAAMAMQDLSKLTDSSLASMAEWWLAFRSGNDWEGYYEVTNLDIALPETVKNWRDTLLNDDLKSPQREQAAKQLARDPAGGKVLIQLAADEKLPDWLMQTVGGEIFSNPDQSVRVLAGEYFKKPGRDHTYVISDILRLEPDPANGKTAFAEVCSSCHRLGDTGQDIGPDLSNIKKKLDRKTLVDAIVNPDANIVFGYEPLLVTTKDGNSIYGFLQSDGKNVILKDGTGKQVTIPSAEISSRKPVRSMMPDPSALGLSEQQLADVVAYLMR